MINPVAPFYEFFLTLTSSLPSAFSAFVSISFVCFIILSILKVFWSSR